MVDAFEEYKEKPGTCVECGNSAVNHFETYCGQTMAVFMNGLVRGARGKWLVRTLDWIFARLEPLLYRVLAMVPGVRFGDDPKVAATYRSQVVWEEAQKRGVLMQQLRFWRKGTELYRARINDRWFYFQSLPMPYGLDSVADVTDDKDQLTRTLRERGVAAPESVSVKSLAGAKQAFSKFGGPVVVKPRSGSRGRHTTVNVKTEDDLAIAFQSAQKLCHYVVIETYLEGSVCRGTVVGGKLAGFLQGFPPRIIGDGVSTIRELIERANKERGSRVQDIVVTDEHISFLRRAGLTLNSVLQKDQIISLTHRTGRLFGGTTRELLKTVHPKLREYIERAATVTKIPVVGFDLIIKDPEADPDEQEWGVIEGNGLPYIDLHYLPLEGEPSLVASDVWDYVEAHPQLY